VSVGRRWKIIEKRYRLHDLTRLAVTALRHLKIGPRFLDWMLALGVEPLDGRNFSAGNTDQWRDAGTRRPAADMDGASPTHANATTKLRSGEANNVADHPQQGCIVLCINRDRATIDLK